MPAILSASLGCAHDQVGVRNRAAIVHATKQILDQWGEDGWELVQVLHRATAATWWPT